jgi:hypothetical protein
MLTDAEILRVWEHMLAAETRALYFADLARRATRRKQVIAWLSFFLSSGAVAAIIVRSPWWVPMLCSLFVAAATAYTMAANLDGQITTLANLQSAWGQLAVLYGRLWQHVDEPGGVAELHRLQERELEPSDLAVRSAPYNESLLARWQTHVFRMYHLEQPA